MKKTIISMFSALILSMVMPAWADDADASTTPANQAPDTSETVQQPDVGVTPDTTTSTVNSGTTDTTSTTDANVSSNSGTTTQSTTTTTTAPATDSNVSDNSGTATQSTTTTTTTTENNVAAVADVASNVSGTIELSQHRSKLYARLVLTQPKSKKGTIKVMWIAPANSGCRDTEYSLNYRYKKFHSRAYRTLVQSGAKGARQFCVGVWQAKLVDANNKVLAQASFDVKDKRSASDAAATSVNATTATTTTTTTTPSSGTSSEQKTTTSAPQETPAQPEPQEVQVQPEPATTSTPSNEQAPPAPAAE